MEYISIISSFVPPVCAIITLRNRVKLYANRLIIAIALLSLAVLAELTLAALRIDRIAYYNYFTIYEYTVIGFLLFSFEPMRKALFASIGISGLVLLSYLQIESIGINSIGINYLTMCIESFFLFIFCGRIIRVVDVTSIRDCWGDIRLRTAISFGIYFLSGFFAFWLIEYTFFQLIHAFFNTITNLIMGVGLIWKTKAARSFLTHYKHLDFSLQS